MRYTDRLHEILDKTLDRLKLASVTQFDNELRFAWKKLHSVGLFVSLIESLEKYKPAGVSQHDLLYGSRKGLQKDFENLEEQVGYCLYVLEGFVPKNFSLGKLSVFGAKPEERQNYVISDLVTPLFNFLHDTLEANGFVLYLLEKYKKRAERFLKASLSGKYAAAEKSYETILEDDLRLFLFDQGMENALSTPKSASGRADVVGAIDTKDPLVAEVKVIDRNKKYDKSRIKSGFAQIVKYSADYHKDSGYFVIFNMDDREIHFSFGNQNNGWPPRLELDGRTYYFVVVNLYPSESASKQKKLKAMTITKDDLVDAVK